MRTTRGFRWMALIVCIAALLVAMAAAISVSARRRPRPNSNLPPAHGPFTMNGLLPGMTRDECIAILGPPTKEYVRDGKLSYLHWKEHYVLASFGSDRNPYPNLVWSISGSELREAEGRVVLDRKSPTEDFHAVLPHAQYLDDMPPVVRGQYMVFELPHYVVRGDRVLFRFYPTNMGPKMMVEAWLPAEEALNARSGS